MQTSTTSILGTNCLIISFTTGLESRQGPHHGAEKYTRVGVGVGLNLLGLLLMLSSLSSSSLSLSLSLSSGNMWRTSVWNCSWDNMGRPPDLVVTICSAVFLLYAPRGRHDDETDETDDDATRTDRGDRLRESDRRRVLVLVLGVKAVTLTQPADMTLHVITVIDNSRLRLLFDDDIRAWTD